MRNAIFERLSNSTFVSRRSVVTLLVVQAALAFGLTLLYALRRDTMAFVTLAAGFAYIGFLRAYQRGWEPARYLTVVLITALIVGFLREPHLTERPSLAILIPPVLALALTRGRWVLAIAALEYAVVVLRGGRASVYLDVAQILIFSSIVSGIALSRAVMDRALARVAAQRERAERARAEAEQRALEISAQRDRLSLMAQLLDAVDQAIFAADAGGKVVYANRAAGTLVEGGATVDRQLAAVLRLESENGESVAPSAARDARGVVVVRPDGARVPVLVVESPLENAERTLNGTVTVCTDVSQIQRLEAELHHAQRLDGIGRLAGGIAHDFNNLLTVIGGAASMAQRKLPAAHGATEELDEVVLATSRAGDLTRQLLAFARKQELIKRPVELSALVQGMERMLRRVIGEDIELSTSIAPQQLVVNADAGQLEQVLLNLVLNARDAMPSGGRISVVTAVAAGDGDGKTYARFDVVDSGSGISPEVKARMFEPFFTTKPGGRGTGLGLATCFGIVKQHEGRIHVASEVGQGTRVSVFLPCTAAMIEEPVTGVRALPRGSESVLLAEDDEAVRKLMAHALREAGYRVAVAENGKKALELAGAQKFDVLVTDVVMPELGGPELAVLVRRANPDLAIVLTSGYADTRSRQRQRALRDAIFMQKPFSPAELVEAMKLAQLRDGARALQRA